MLNRRLLFVSAVLFGVVAAAGCESAEKDRDRNRDRVRSRERISRDPDTDRRRDRDDVIISEGDRGRGIDAIPRRALRIDPGRGTAEMTYKARRDGTLYVYDVDDDQIVWQGTLRDGERFILDPTDGVALIDGKAVLERDLRPRHAYRLYFAENGLR